jgi:hypothetical protein
MAVSTTKKGKQMELLIVTLVLAALATVGQLRDALGGQYNSKRD